MSSRDVRTRVAASRLDEFREVATQLAAAAGAETGPSSTAGSAQEPVKVGGHRGVTQTKTPPSSTTVGAPRCSNDFAQVAELTSVQLHGPRGSALSKWIDERTQAHAFVSLSD
jgi:hypothetical protein